MNQALTRSGDQNGPNYTSLAVTVVLSVVFIEAGAFLFIIGALILGTMLYLVLAAATLERKSTIDAMRRSKQTGFGEMVQDLLPSCRNPDHHSNIFESRRGNRWASIHRRHFHDGRHNRIEFCYRTFIPARLSIDGSTISFKSRQAKSIYSQTAVTIRQHETAAHPRLSSSAQQFLPKVQRVDHARRKILS